MMTKKQSLMIGSLCLLFLASIFTYFLPFPFLIESDFYQMVYLLMSATPLLGSFYVLKCYGVKSSQGKIFTLISMAFLFLFIGEFLWTIFIFMGIDPYPSAADYFYILFYPLLFLALMRQLKVTNIDWRFKSLFLKVIMVAFALVLMGLVGYFGVYVAYDSQLSFIENAVAIAYGIGDLILILLAFFVLKMADEFKGGRLFVAWLMFSVALFITLIADIGFAIYTVPYEESVLWALRTMDLFWVASFLVFAGSLFSLGNIVKDAQQKALIK